MSKDREDLEKHRRGERINNDQSLSVFKSLLNDGHQHNWRTIVCVDDRDVCECSACGQQQEFSCNFDEDFS